MKQNVKREVKAKFNDAVRNLIEDNVESLAKTMGVDEINVFEIAKGCVAEMEIEGELTYVNVDSVVKSNSFDLEDALMELEDRKKREAEREAKKIEKLKKLQEKAKAEAANEKASE